MLTLGIPGSPTAAVLLGGLLIWGLQPGPLLFVEQKDFVWGTDRRMYLGNVVGLVVVLTTVPLLAAILRIPFSIIAPVIVAICAVGAFTVNNAMIDLFFMVGVRHHRLRVQEARLSAGPAGAGAGVGRPGGELLPAGHARFGGQPLDLLVELAGWQHHRLSMIMLFWPLISKVIGLLRRQFRTQPA